MDLTLRVVFWVITVVQTPFQEMSVLEVAIFTFILCLTAQLATMDSDLNILLMVCDAIISCVIIVFSV